MRKDGPNRVIFTLQEGNADFPVSLSAQTFYILPVVDGEVQPGIGTGGYMLESWDPGVRGSLKRHPNFFREDRAFFDSVEITVVADPTSRQTGLVTGEFDIIDDVPPITANLLAKKAGVKVLNTPGLKHYTFPMRLDMAPFKDNNDLRLALKYAFDRQDALDRWLQGYGALGNDHPISPANRFYAPDIPQREYDPDKAKFHLKKAGMEGFSHELSGSDFYAGCMDLILLYKEHAAKAGIRDHPQPDADRRLLVRRVAQAPLERFLLERPAHRGLDVYAGLRGRVQLETRPTGSTSASTCCSGRHGRSSMRPSGATCTERCSSSAATRADRSSPSSRAGSAPTTRRSCTPKRWRATGAMDGYKYLQRWLVRLSVCLSGMHSSRPPPGGGGLPWRQPATRCFRARTRSDGVARPMRSARRRREGRRGVAQGRVTLAGSVLPT